MGEEMTRGFEGRSVGVKVDVRSCIPDHTVTAQDRKEGKGVNLKTRC